AKLRCLLATPPLRQTNRLAIIAKIKMPLPRNHSEAVPDTFYFPAFLISSGKGMIPRFLPDG
ncbi:MAG: hypothetical protein MUP41_09960, partial [Desulfobacterales bacterium]|nr:hypothetical protein [Desulfobacterales bacterium]